MLESRLEMIMFCTLGLIEDADNSATYAPPSSPWRFQKPALLGTMKPAHQVRSDCLVGDPHARTYNCRMMKRNKASRRLTCTETLVSSSRRR